MKPGVYTEAEEEILKERAKLGNTVYAALYPGRDSVAAALKGHGWGHQTVADYRRWAALRLVLWHPRGCPVCHIMDGSAVHILEAHCAPRLPDSATSGPLGALALLQTSKPPRGPDAERGPELGLACTGKGRAGGQGGRTRGRWPGGWLSRAGRRRKEGNGGRLVRRRRSKRGRGEGMIGDGLRTSRRA